MRMVPFRGYFARQKPPGPYRRQGLGCFSEPSEVRPQHSYFAVLSDTQSIHQNDIRNHFGLRVRDGC